MGELFSWNSLTEVKTMNRQAGWTLVEMAIIMIVMGLLLGGVLKGQAIIVNAKIKNLENDYQGISVAIYSYRERYGALPGDDRYASKRFKIIPLVTSIANGDGNGKIRGPFDDVSEPPDHTKESRHLWAHLRSAQLITGVAGSPVLPLHIFNGITGVASSTQSLKGRIPFTLSGIFVGFTNIPNHIALILESRNDDNFPHSGQIQTQAFNYTNPSVRHKIYFAL
jgi:type II secretory pathway pseudopilin PulG